MSLHQKGAPQGDGVSDATRIKELLRERVADLAQYLFPLGHREGVHWRVGSIEGEPGKSFDICIAGPKAGLWGDFAEQQKHSRSLLDLWMLARKVDFKTALHQAAEWLGESLNRQTAKAQSGATRKSVSIFRSLDDAVASAERRLKMRATRRDKYHEDFVVVRFDGRRKEFRPFCRSGSGWMMSDPPGKLPLFRLPELLSRPGEFVLNVEGEKCACDLATLGLLVTTSAHGAKSAHETDWQPLAGREVVILPDNDDEGRAYAQTVAGILMRLSPPAVVRIVELPRLPPKGDCVEWLDAREAQTPEDITAELQTLIKGVEVIREVRDGKSKPTELPEATQTKPFPLHCLPPICKAMASAITETERTPESLAGRCTLGILSASVGAGLQVQSGAQRVTRGNVHIVASAESGSGKSEVFRHATRPFFDFEREEVETWQKEILPGLQAEQDILESEIGKLKKQAGDAECANERDEIKARLKRKKAEIAKVEALIYPPVLHCEDVTTEKLAVILSKRDEQLASLSPDAGAIVNNLLGRYSKLDRTDEIIYVKAYSGDFCRVDRQTRESIVLRSPCLATLWVDSRSVGRHLTD